MPNIDTEQVNKQTVPMSAEVQELVAQQGGSNAQFLGNAYGIAQDEEESITGYKKTVEVQAFNEENQLTDYPLDLKQWIDLQVQEKQRALLEQEREANRQLLERERKAKQELEEIIAMIAHHFRGYLQNIEYNAEHKNQKTRTIKSVQAMSGFIDIFCLISANAVKLREKMSQDQQGDRTLTSVLVKSLSLAMSQVLTVGQIDAIDQHYLSYAKKTAQIPSTATWKQLTDDYLDILVKLQTEWESSFMALVAKSDDLLTDICIWTQARFFPVQILGFEENPICFKRYGATESVLMTVMTEMLLNTIKYYCATTDEPIIVRWECQPESCKLICENPTTEMESESSKGSYQGQSFLKMIARKLEGHFTYTLRQNRYTAEFSLPRYLLIEEKI
jgi:signal transduction histidine kinase